MALEFNSDDVIQTSKVASGMGDFFPESGMRASEVRRIQANYAQNIAPLQDRLMNLDNNIMRLRSQDLAYQTSLIAYEKEKDEMELRKQYHDPDALNKIGEILETDKPPLQQRNDILELGLNNPQLLQHNPAFATAYRTGLQQTETRAKIKAEEEAPAKAARNSFANVLINTGTPEGIEAATRLYAGESSMDEATRVYSDIQKEKTARSRAGKQLQTSEARLKRTISDLVSPKKEDIKDSAEYRNASLTERQSMEAAFSATGGKKFTDEYRLRLARDLMFYTDGQLDGRTITLDEALNLPEKELYEAVDAAVRKQETILQGKLDPADTVITPMEAQMGQAWNRNILPQIED